MPSPAADRPALCVYCGALTPRDAPPGAACAACKRVARPEDISWERVRPRAGASRARGALFSTVVFAVALAMLARIAWVIRDAPGVAAVVLVVVALGLLFIALGAAGQLVDDLFGARWRFTSRDWRVRGEVTTRFGRVIRGGARVARFSPLALPAGAAAMSSAAVRAAGARALLDALPARWLERHWWSGAGSWERTDETAVVVLCAALGLAARGELELLREEDTGWTLARARQPATPVARAQARERAALRPGPASGSAGAPWLERSLVGAVGRLTAAIAAGSEPGDASGGPYRAAAAEAGATSLAAALRAITAPADAADQLRWEWLAREMDASAAEPGTNAGAAAAAGAAAGEGGEAGSGSGSGSGATSASVVSASALGATLAEFCTEQPELAALLLAEIYDALEMVG